MNTGQIRPAIVYSSQHILFRFYHLSLWRLAVCYSIRCTGRFLANAAALLLMILIQAFMFLQEGSEVAFPTVTM